MQSHAFLSEYRLRVRSAVDKVARLTALRARVRNDLAERRKQVAELSHTYDVLAKVGELFRSLMDHMVMEHVKSIENVVTEGLKTIFTDQALSFEAVITQRYNKVAIDFYLVQAAERTPIRAHPLEAFGGGPSSIASLILKVLAMRRLKKWPLLVLDETLAAVSDEYIDQTGVFLRKLAKQTGLHVLLVTHKAGFLDNADVAYRAGFDVDEDGVRALRLDRIGHHAVRE